MLKIIDDMESVADAIYQLSKVIENLKQSNSNFTEHQNHAIMEMLGLVHEAFIEMNHNLNNNFSDMDIKNAYAIEKKINDRRNLLRQKHVEDLKEKRYKHKTGAFYTDMISINERIGDYIINVSEAIKEYQEVN